MSAPEHPREGAGEAATTKYSLGPETLQVGPVTLRRLHALRPVCSGVTVGTLGGWVESEANLADEGSCWVSGEAQVCGKALVSGEAQVCGEARVSGEARVCGEARLNAPWVWTEVAPGVSVLLPLREDR